METDLFHSMAEAEERHWWFAGRRAIVENAIKSLHLPHDAEIFEAGCGTGGNLEMLARHGRLYAGELDDVARNYAIQRKVCVIERCCLPDEIPFGEKQFDLIVLTDVLEHVPDDSGSLRALYQRLKPGGSLLLTVPAFPFLWSHHDEIHHHKRRYVRASLSRIVSDARFAIQFVSYYNTLLFPIVAGVRLGGKLRGNDKTDVSVPREPINQLLYGLFSSEKNVIGSLSLPFGVSLILLAHRQP
jgi:SAM-dependent methyltransferase